MVDSPNYYYNRTKGEYYRLRTARNFGQLNNIPDEEFEALMEVAYERKDLALVLMNHLVDCTMPLEDIEGLSEPGVVDDDLNLIVDVLRGLQSDEDIN